MISNKKEVTILILIDGFLQFSGSEDEIKNLKEVTILILIDGFLQYKDIKQYDILNTGHNPYFNRWFSAIVFAGHLKGVIKMVTILILIDGFLQYRI